MKNVFRNMFNNATKNAIVGALLDELEDNLEDVKDRAEALILARDAQPEIWRRFHEEMLRRLPRWRLLARLYHKHCADRYAALASAKAVAAFNGQKRRKALS